MRTKILKFLRYSLCYSEVIVAVFYLHVVQDDLSDRAVSDHEMNKFVKENGFLCWESMSVKLNRNVSETFW